MARIVMVSLILSALFVWIGFDIGFGRDKTLASLFIFVLPAITVLIGFVAGVRRKQKERSNNGPG
jgi:hypothetical protein